MYNIYIDEALNCHCRAQIHSVNFRICLSYNMMSDYNGRVENVNNRVW